MGFKVPCATTTPLGNDLLDHLYRTPLAVKKGESGLLSTVRGRVDEPVGFDSPGTNRAVMPPNNYTRYVGRDEHYWS